MNAGATAHGRAQTIPISTWPAWRRCGTCGCGPRGAAEGTFAGPHKSHFRGTAVEFADYREYAPGDDIRLVDWKVFARTDRHYVRLYDAERNLLTYLVVDKSGSMEFAGAVQTTADASWNMPRGWPPRWATWSCAKATKSACRSPIRSCTSICRRRRRGRT